MKKKTYTSKRKLDNLPEGSVITFGEFTSFSLTYRKIEDGWAHYKNLSLYRFPLSSQELAADGEPFRVVFEPTETNYMLENNSNVILENVHKAAECVGDTCAIHKKTKHHMRGMPQVWRPDRGIIERRCPHGVGHVDPDSPFPKGSYEWIHGCCGFACCVDPKLREKSKKMGTYSTIHSNDLHIPAIVRPIAVDRDDDLFKGFDWVAQVLEMNLSTDTSKELGKPEVEYITNIDNIMDATYNDMKMYYFAENLPKFVEVVNKACDEPVTGSFIVVGEEHNFTEYEVTADGKCYQYNLDMKPVRKNPVTLN